MNSTKSAYTLRGRTGHVARHRRLVAANLLGIWWVVLEPGVVAYGAARREVHAISWIRRYHAVVDGVTPRPP